MFWEKENKKLKLFESTSAEIPQQKLKCEVLDEQEIEKILHTLDFFFP